MRRIPVIICTDLEPDAREPDPSTPTPWKGFEATAKLFEEWRPAIEQRTKVPAHFSWFIRLDEQVEHIYGSKDWPARTYKSLIDSLIKAGDEIGLHVHAWRRNEAENFWYADHGNPGWLKETMEDALATFKRAFGRECRSTRMGDRFLSQDWINTFEAAGVRYNLTLEPGHMGLKALVEGEHATGEIPDYSYVPRVPYYPSSKDYRIPGPGNKNRICMIPLSCGGVDEFTIKTRAPFYVPVLSSGNSKITYDKVALWYPPAQFRKMLDEFLKEVRPAQLAFAVRSDAVLGFENIIRENLRYLFSHPQSSRFVVCTPEEAMNILNCNLAGRLLPAGKKFKEIFIRKKPLKFEQHILTARPLHQVEQQAENIFNFSANGADPQLELVCATGSIPNGWLKFSANLKTTDFKPQPKIYWDNGEGMNEKRSIDINVNDNNIESIFYLPPETQALRFDPAEAPGKFVLENVRLQTVFAGPINLS